MKNKFASLLVLASLVAFAVGFLGEGAAWAQAPEVADNFRIDLTRENRQGGVPPSGLTTITRTVGGDVNFTFAKHPKHRQVQVTLDLKDRQEMPVDPRRCGGAPPAGLARPIIEFFMAEVPEQANPAAPVEVSPAPTVRGPDRFSIYGVAFCVVVRHATNLSFTNVFRSWKLTFDISATGAHRVFVPAKYPALGSAPLIDTADPVLPTNVEALDPTTFVFFDIAHMKTATPGKTRSRELGATLQVNDVIQNLVVLDTFVQFTCAGGTAAQFAHITWSALLRVRLAPRGPMG